jgi:hypothetical protein
MVIHQYANIDRRKGGATMKHEDRRRNGGYGDKCASIAIAGAAMLAAITSGGCLYTAIPVMAGQTGSYHAPDDNQPAQSSQSSQSSNDQATQNKQQSGAPQTSTPQNSPPPQGQSGGATP